MIFNKLGLGNLFREKDTGFHIGIYLIILLIAIQGCSMFGNNAQFSVQRLRIEYLKNPMGVDTPKPRFTWVLESNKRDVQQKAWQVQVASSRELLNDGKADMWNSQKTASENSVNITYQGKPLKSDHTYYWKIHVWDQDGDDTWSKVETFHTGLFESSDWQGDWISAPDTTISAPLMRKEFSLHKPVKRATAFVTGVGYYEFYLNGKKVGDHVLDPGMTDYHKRVLYATYDVTKQMKNGANAAGFILGNGAWRMRTMKNRYAWKNRKFGNPMAILQLNITFNDGTEKHIVTDASWKSSEGPITYNNIYGGEDYDARNEQPGWTTPGFDDSDWNGVKKTVGPGGKLQAQLMPAIKVVKTIKPVKRIHPADSVYLYDLGQNMPGWWRIRVQGQAGTTLRIRGAETLNDSLFPTPLKPGDHLSTKQKYHRQVYTDYTLKGDGEEIYEPRFFYSGFRYVEVKTDQPGGLDTIELEGRVVHTALEQTGQFSTSDILLNKIHEATVWSQIGNTHSYPSDCPHREKGAYTGDGEVIAEASIHDFNMAPFYTNWVADMRDAQQENGRVPNTSPTLIGGTGGGIAWGSAYILVPWWMHQYYGDTRILKDHYSTMKKYLGYLHQLGRSDSNPDEKYIINDFGGYWDSLGEWCAPKQSDGPNHPLVSTAYWYIDAMKFADIAEFIGNSDDANHYRALADTIRQSFNKKFFDVKSDLYGADQPYQTYLALALAHNLTPKGARTDVLKKLVDDITQTHQGHLNTGILGTKHLFPVLLNADHGDVAYNMVHQTTNPSWGFWIKKGATTLWEKWSGKASHNHQMFGSVDEFFYKYLAGIRPPANNESQMAYHEIKIRPFIPASLDSAGASIQTVRGKVSSTWKKKENGLTLSIHLPANTEGMISVPLLSNQNVEIRESGRVIWNGDAFQPGTPGIRGGRRDGKFISFTVGSGSYTFDMHISGNN